MILEACVETYQQALNAQKNGANRIELCGDLSVGGITPDINLVKELQQQLIIPMMVMVRPRGGKFVFSDLEMKVMVDTILSLRKIGVHGIVIGNLTESNEVHFEQNSILAKAAFPMNVTFHKAIDVVRNVFASLDRLLKINEINRILTSGQSPTAVEGSGTIKKMKAYVGNEKTIISAGKITKKNLKQIHQKIGGKEYHGRLIVGEI